MIVGHVWISIVFEGPTPQRTNECFPYIMYLNAIQYMQLLIISHNLPSMCHNLFYFMQMVYYLIKFLIVMTCIYAK